MSKFNTAAKYPMPELTENHCGWAAYAMDAKTKLVTQVLTSFFNESKFYGDNSEDLEKTVLKLIGTDPEFVSKMAIFARREFNMRSVSHVLVGYLAHEINGKKYVKETVKNIVLRGDDATEILAFYLSKFGKPIPNSLRKALRDAFTRFDEYTLAKYKGDSKSVKMRDILCLCHPTPTSEEQSKAWKDLLEDTIKPAYTWETELSAKGNNKETWEELIASNRLPYMATLRNLRNILNAKPDNLEKVLKYISNPEAVRKSRQLPFRYYAAYSSIFGNAFPDRRVMDTLEDAVDISIENLQKIPGKTMIAIDVSGSMSQNISNKSDIHCCDIAMMLGVIANRICEDATVYTFDTSINKLYIPHRNGILDTVRNMRMTGGGTNMSLPFVQIQNDFVQNGIVYDRTIVLSDNECNTCGSYGWYRTRPMQEYADEYRKLSGNRNFWVHAIDLCGYGTQQFAGPKTNIIAGWSEKVFEFIRLAEEGSDSLVKRISEYHP